MFEAKGEVPSLVGKWIKSLHNLTLATNCLSFWSKLAVGAT